MMEKGTRPKELFQNSQYNQPELKSSTYVPKIHQFSGDDPPQKGDVSFNEWRFEIQCLLADPDMTPSVVLQAVRRSLKSTARKMLISLGERAGVEDILSKLDILFGDVVTNGMIMQEFFNAFQKKDESVTAFGCWLESMLQLAIDYHCLDRNSKNDLLRHKFWISLKSDQLKSQTRHKYDTIKEYDELMREIRQVEKELSLTLPNVSAVH
ncbi:modulator of apoptosis 1-like [Gigantopelta aegis]|uniref:modulator of apoptosis 1-like n=1 Tax=Gigantopelta aegis TaxID=1735272 RepID=UPI001B889872|nr:modulator of apoptosis 1-like [Gigantopelta aegis]